jgi:hypothetical protein
MAPNALAVLTNTLTDEATTSVTARAGRWFERKLRFASVAPHSFVVGHLSRSAQRGSLRS